MNAALLSVALGIPAAAQTVPQTESPADLTLYAARSAATVGPVVAAFQQRTGLKVNVVYGSDQELKAALLAGTPPNPADLYWANTLLPLDALNAQHRLLPLPARTLSGVAPQLLSGQQEGQSVWLPTNVRYRVLAYSTDRIDPKTLPASVLDLPRLASLRGRVGWAVADPTFQQFLAGLIVSSGEDAARTWLEGMKALKPRDFGTENMGLMQAIQNGDIDVALTSHVFVQRVRRASYKVGTQFFRAGDVGNLRDLSGLALVQGGTHRTAALRFLDLVARPETQAFMLSVNFEYPAIPTVAPSTLNLFADTLASAPALTPAQISAALPAAVRLLEDADLL